MTVNELLDHFDFYPDKIVYYDEPNNIQDKCTFYNEDAPYGDFLDEYGERNVKEWLYLPNGVLDLELR